LGSGGFQPASCSFTPWKAERGLSEKEINDASNIFESTFWNGEDFLENVQKHFPEIRTLHELWEGTPLKNLALTTVGIAIGHANLSRASGFKGELSTWIQ
jgi:hypothetical protein